MLNQSQSLYPAAIHGYLQTPLGGRPGSSSIKRPTFAELGADHVSLYDKVFSLQQGKFVLYSGYEKIRPQAMQQLVYPLKTYGTQIAQGTLMRSDIQFDWYRLGGAYYGLLIDKLWLIPQLELAILDFAYRFTTDTRRGRAYHHATLRLGLTAQYPYNPLSYFTLSGATSLSPSQFGISTLAAQFHIKLPGNRTCFLGAKYLKIYYRDGQDMPNDIRLSTNIMPIIGCN